MVISRSYLGQILIFYKWFLDLESADQFRETSVSISRDEFKKRRVFSVESNIIRNLSIKQTITDFFQIKLNSNFSFFCYFDFFLIFTCKINFWC